MKSKKEKEEVLANVWSFGWIPLLYLIYLESRDGGIPWASGFFFFVWAAWWWSKQDEDGEMLEMYFAYVAIAAIIGGFAALLNYVFG